MGTAYRYHPPTPRDSPEAWALESEADDGSQGEAIFVTLPTDFAPVQVSDAELTAALTTLWLNIPLRLATPRPPLYVGRRLALASAPLSGEAWRSDLAQSYGRYCARCGTPGDCLTLFEDGPRFQDDDKRRLALALAVGPALEGVDAEVRAMLNPTQLLTMLSISIAGYMALLLAPVPEPVTKGIALAFSVFMWGYLGWEFFDLLRAYAQLYEDAPRASTFAELREVGERFGKVIGPNSVRILVMVATAAIGETAALMSKGSKLPGFGQASRTVELNTGMRLMDAATGAERVIVSVNEGTIRLVLPVNAVSMTARNSGGGRSSSEGGAAPKRDKLLSNRHRAFQSFDAFKKAMGPAGEDKAWHHIVEQRKPNVERFGPEAIHNTENVIAVNKSKHDAISAYYSTKSDDTGGMVVREWLRTKSYEEQRAFGLMILRRFKAIP
ncbi:hypothetical protein [Archangium sp.]|uniref:SitA5 family polymorphic toxin n=1 Tax=Archangium sp. TaxID=1872627 RepID=UPI002D464026|nr:hypothetical protein [Archangium sp.]HYO51888.1 hypothetical protein [Archangium sp.]